jgi:hypothetical protein
LNFDQKIKVLLLKAGKEVPVSPMTQGRTTETTASTTLLDGLGVADVFSTYIFNFCWVDKEVTPL